LTTAPPDAATPGDTGCVGRVGEALLPPERSRVRAASLPPARPMRSRDRVTITFACHGERPMPTKPPLDRLHQHAQTKRTAKRTGQPPTLSEPSAGEMAERDVYYPKGHFGPQHGLTPAQAWQAQQLLNRANRLRPLRGPDAQARFALRMGGIIAAVKSGRVGNSAFGRKLHGHRGGNVMARHALYHLRRIAPLGSQAAAAKRQGPEGPQ